MMAQATRHIPSLLFPLPAAPNEAEPCLAPLCSLCAPRSAPALARSSCSPPLLMLTAALRSRVLRKQGSLGLC
eukprot:2325418-Rhodomonas_salina.2